MNTKIEYKATVNFLICSKRFLKKWYRWHGNRFKFNFLSELRPKILYTSQITKLFKGLKVGMEDRYTQTEWRRRKCKPVA